MVSLLVPEDGGLITLLAAVLLLSAVLQAMTGFGFAVLSAPILTALTNGPTAVSTILVTGTVADLLILSVRSARPAPSWGDVGVVGVSSVPGIVIGTLLLLIVPKSVLMFIIAGAVIVAVGLRLRMARRRNHPQAVGRRWGVLAGLLSGTSSAATTLAGPPTVFYLAHRGHAPSTTRDTLVMLNLVRLPLSIAALLAAGAFTTLPGLAWLVVAVLAGYALGSRFFGRMDLARYERVTLVGLLLAAATAVVVAFSIA
ncbi:sulfite exporter TauE/SafE family protein [Microbacterium sp. NPDC089698]|uniref:sulfite exporter TauE/SafE family protein n=1 Tax=Microbacterium sp. NPDC089698 TaxID=3364200 RepID=UPI00382F7748